MANSDQKANWSRYWEGRVGSLAGEALVGAGIESHAEIISFWKRIFADLPPETRVLDLACGAGSVLRSALENDLTDVTGADISEGAIAALKEKFPTAKTALCSAEVTPFQDNSFDIIGSQFGFEYAGAIKCVPEIARLLAPKGQFVAIAHKAGSAIETEVREQFAKVKKIDETGFIPAARHLFEVDFSEASDDEFAKVAKAFAPAQAALLDIAKSHKGLAAHLYQGTQQLYERRKAYDLEDILKWLEGMEVEISTFLGRMQSMMAAALSDQDVKEFLAGLQAQGLICEPPDVLRLDEARDEAGWILQAHQAA